MTVLGQHRALTIGTWILALEAISWGVSSALIPLRLAELGAARLAIGAVFVVSSTVAVFAAPIAGDFSDRREPIAAIRTGLLITPLLLIGIGLTTSATVLGLLTIICIGGALSTLGVPASTVVMRSADRIGGGAAAATFILVFAIGETLGASVGAALAQETSDLVPFAALAVLMLCTLALMRRHR
jgi:predicted MFS family arabinose efflux permease